jgi:drug/metabolite transporter (DMT)-like permease
MIGGMVLPFLFGLVMGEEFKVVRVVCCLIIVAAIILTSDKSGKHRGGFKYYISVFLLNGIIGVVSKLHQASPTLCVDSASFMMISKMWMILIASTLLFIKGRKYAVSKKAALFCGIYAIVNSTGNLLALIALLALPASVQYPLITGGTMFFALIIAVVRRDKITAKDVLGTVLAMVATVVIVL